VPHNVFENLPKLTYSLRFFGEKDHSLSLLLFARRSFRKGLPYKTKSNTEAENHFSL